MRYNDYNFHLSVIMRMGTITAYDGRDPSRYQQLTTLDPAAIGKAMWEAAAPRLPFHDLPRQKRINSEPSPYARLAAAVGAPSPGNMERTSAHAIAISDGYETRFQCSQPAADTSDRTCCFFSFDTVLSTQPPFFPPEAPPNPKHSLLIAPWQDAEMLGQAILELFAMSGPPVNKKMTSVFDPPEPKRDTILHRAATVGHVQEMPARKPRNLDPANTAGTTPFMLAAGAGHLEMTSRLLDWGASLESQDHLGRTPLHHASAGGHEEVVGILLEAGADPSSVDQNGSSPLHFAAAGGWVVTVAQLLAGGASPNAQDRIYSSTPLHLAARVNHRSLLPLLADAGANPNAANEAGRTPLHVASAYDHSELVRELIDVGADSNRQDNQGESPLHRAAFYQHLDCMEALVQSGANSGATDHQGNSPLHVAARMNRVQAVQLLLDAGADPEATNEEGMTPLDLAVVSAHRTWRMGTEHNSETVETLLQRGATLVPRRLPTGERHALWPNLTSSDLLLPTGDIDYAKLSGLPEAMKEQLPLQDEYGNRPLNDTVSSKSLLHDAVSKEMPHLVENLLKSGASPITAVRLNPSPLHLAAGQGNREMVDLLLKWGADLETPICNAPDGRYEGWVIQWRVENPGRDCQDFVTEFGAKWLRIGHSMRTALDYSVECNQVEMVRHLLDLGARPMPYINERPPFFGPDHYPPGKHGTYRWVWANSPEAQAMAEMFRELVEIPYPPRFQ